MDDGGAYWWWNEINELRRKVKELEKENQDLRDTIEYICFEINLDSSEFLPERND